MAHLKDLIVSGVTRFIGKVYGTITNAIKDDKDQTISSTYIKDISGGRLNHLDFTKGDGSIGSVAMEMEPRVIDLGDQETDTKACAGSSQGMTIYSCSNWTDKPAGAPDTQGTLITVAYNNTSNVMGSQWTWAHQYFMSPFVTYPWVRMGSATVLTEWTPINYNVNMTNPNLLINPNFKINQRKITSGSIVNDQTYTLDRWKLGYGAGNGNFQKLITITSESITLTTTLGNDSGYWGDLYQPFETPLAPGYYSMSAKINGEIRTFSGYLEKDGLLFDGLLVLYQTAFAIRFGIGEMTIEWVKLEAGSISTQFVPPDPATELMKCMRYYEVMYVSEKALGPDDVWISGARFNVEKYRIPDVVIKSVLGTPNVLSTYTGADSNITITGVCNKTKKEIHASPCSTTLGHVLYGYVAYVDAEIY